jgi:hypothetical protein
VMTGRKTCKTNTNNVNTPQRPGGGQIDANAGAPPSHRHCPTSAV